VVRVPFDELLVRECIGRVERADQLPQQVLLLLLLLARDRERLVDELGMKVGRLQLLDRDGCVLDLARAEQVVQNG